MTHTSPTSPWVALVTMMLGFFMILVDSTIVSVAIPAITAGLGATYNQVIWVNSAYLLAYAVPLLVTGRFGDRFGPRAMYLGGLALFTASSLACGMAGTIEALIIARTFQGLGGAMVTPQTMSMMIRTFKPEERGGAMGVWGATAGVATIVGPLAGGLLVDAAGWQWIFFVNVPIGIIGLALAWINLPRLERFARNFDWPGVVLSSAGMFGLIFGIQEGEHFNWDWRALTLIAGGIVLLCVFAWWQTRTRRDALVPPELFRDRNFTLASLTIATVGFTITTYMIPWMIYIQSVQGFTPTQAALLILPAGVVSGLLSPKIGAMTNTRSPKPFAIAGLVLMGLSVVLVAVLTDPAIDPTWMLAISVLTGLGNSMMWGPLSMIATRNLHPRLAGSGSSVYNTVRQVGAVIGSASIAAAMTAQLTRQLGPGASTSPANAGTLPDALHAPFAQAMSHSLWLPAGVILVGAVIATMFAKTESWAKAKD
ncbi:DHA2 family efflux MFS transporter permease subunit [Corynebacterium sp. LK2510]|uniref:DHA2 family efflux MFS transporter permease subunit n=1 Tax=Corynebacterium sp. LK2510 TaxID=3110472 RepID=UPI0034CF2860